MASENREAERPCLRRIGRELAWAVAASLVSVLAAMVALGATPGSLAERWRAGGDDQILHYLLFRSATQVFPFAENGALGFPPATTPSTPRSSTSRRR